MHTHKRFWAREPCARFPATNFLQPAHYGPARAEKVYWLQQRGSCVVCIPAITFSIVRVDDDDDDDQR